MTLLSNFQILGGTEVDGVEQAVKGKIEDLLVKHGLSDFVPLTNLNKEKAIHDLLVAEVLVTRTVALDSFFKGLNCLGIGNLLRKHQSIASYVLPSTKEVAIDPEIFKGQLLKGKESNNDGDTCESTEKKQSWEWFLQFVDDAASLKGSVMLCIN